VSRRNITSRGRIFRHFGRDVSHPA
jgi:hypothetical protein